MAGRKPLPMGERKIKYSIYLKENDYNSIKEHCNSIGCLNIEEMLLYYSNQTKSKTEIKDTKPEISKNSLSLEFIVETYLREIRRLRGDDMFLYEELCAKTKNIENKLLTLNNRDRESAERRLRDYYCKLMNLLGVNE